MRSLALATSYPKSPGDGTAPFIRSISHGLCQLGADVDLLLPAHPEVAWPLGDPPVALHTFEYAPPRSRYLHVWGYAGGLQADRALRLRSFAVLPAATASCLARLGALAGRLRPDVIHAHWVVPNGVLAALVAHHRDLPLVISLHGSGVSVAERSAAFGVAARRAFRAARRVTACSEDLAERAVALGAEPARVSVIPYGVDLEAIQPGCEADRSRLRQELGLAEDDRVALAIGRLVAKKGFRYLVSAMVRLRDRMTLIVAGDGDLRGDLEAQVAQSGLGARVRFLGAVDRPRVVSLLKGSDLLVVPSVRDESGNVDGLPNVVLEGMAAGLPIVASRIAGIPSVVSDGETGILVPPGDPEAIATAVASLVEDAGLRARLGAAARRRAERDLAWRTIAGRYLDVLREATL